MKAQLFVALALLCSAAAGGNPVSAGPTAANALAAEENLTSALRANDSVAVARYLAPDWIVVSTYGGMAARDGFLAAIKSRAFTRHTMRISEPRVRLYGDVAVITARTDTSGLLGGKKFNVHERTTDVLVWRDGGWRSVLTHETELHR